MSTQPTPPVQALFCTGCGLLDTTVTVDNRCPACGPIPLCPECSRVHDREIVVCQLHGKRQPPEETP